MFRTLRKLATRLFRDLTNEGKKNIALTIIESFEKRYPGFKTYHRRELLTHLTSVIAKSINTNEYNHLKWKEQDEVTSMIINGLQSLAQNSKNSAPCYTGTFNPTYYDGEFRGAANIHQVKGPKLLTREQNGWYYDREWQELKLPNVFYTSKMQSILQKTIFNAIKSTKYNALISNGLHQLINRTTTTKLLHSATVSPAPICDINQYKEYVNALNQNGLLTLPPESITPSPASVLNINQYKKYAKALEQYGLLKLAPHSIAPSSTSIVEVSLRM